MNPCRCCGMDITDHRERRKLGSAPSAPVLSTLTRLLNRYYREFDVERLRRGCICKGCFGCIQRLTRLEADTKKLQEEIRSRMSSVYVSSDSVLGKHDREVTEGDRSEDEAVPNTPARKRLNFPPISTEPGSSPAVTVSGHEWPNEIP